MTQTTSHIRPHPENPVPDEFDLLCDQCSYSLVGLTCDRCPECGHRFDHTELPLARVPWLYRRRIGARRAYSRTWRMIVSRPREFAAELCRPVRISQEDARLFRRRTIRRNVISGGLIAACMIAWVLRQEALGGGLPSPKADPRSYAMLVGGYIGGILALWAFLSLATDLPTFIWRGLDRSPDDLAPLHHYASAPLALAPYAMLLIAVVALPGGSHPQGIGAIVLACVAVFCVTALVLMLWQIPQLLMRAGAPCSGRRKLALAVYLPFHWLLMLILSIAIFAAVGAFIAAPF
jgi:hypothetical protein